MPTIEEIGRFIGNVGFPAAFLLGLAFVAWRIGVFLAPIVHRVADAHVGMIDTLKENDTEKTAAMSTQSRILSEHTQILQEIRQAVKRP
jgi:hypothetical protein